VVSEIDFKRLYTQHDWEADCCIIAEAQAVRKSLGMRWANHHSQQVNLPWSGHWTLTIVRKIHMGIGNYVHH